jgi:hypothetical protein
MKHRIVHFLQKYVFNPPVKLLFAVGLVRPGYALLETVGRQLLARETNSVVAREMRMIDERARNHSGTVHFLVGQVPTPRATGAPGSPPVLPGLVIRPAYIRRSGARAVMLALALVGRRCGFSKSQRMAIVFGIETFCRARLDSKPMRDRRV